MLDTFTSTQPVADRLKMLIMAGETKGRRAAMETLQRFERCGWQSRMFEDVAQGQLSIDENGAFSYSGENAVAGISDILTRYLEMAGCAEVEFPDPMGLTDAARYLGISVDKIKHNVHRTGLIMATKVGHDLRFSKADLDAFKNLTPRTAGRPKGALNKVKE